MILLAWTLNYGDDNLHDHWIVVETAEEARQEASKLIMEEPKLHCWAISAIQWGSEPHWTEAP